VESVKSAYVHNDQTNRVVMATFFVVGVQNLASWCKCLNLCGDCVI